MGMHVSNPCRLHVTAHEVKPVADDGARQAVARNRHRRQRGPSVVDRLIGFQGAECSHELGRLSLSPRHVDTPAVHTPGNRAAWRRHAGADGTPLIGRWIILLDHVGRTGYADEGGANPAANHVDLIIDRADGSMVARRWHRTARAPAVRCRVIFFYRTHASMRPRRMNGWLARARMRRCAAR